MAIWSLRRTVDNSNPNGGDTVTYTVTVTNLQSASSSFVVVHDALPIGLSINSATTTPGTGMYNSGTGDWDVGTLGPNGTATFVISVTVGSQLDGQSSVANTATVFTSLDPTTILSSSTVPIAVQPATPVNPVCTSNCGGGGGGGGGGGQSYVIAIDGRSDDQTTSSTLSLYGTGAYTMEISNGSNFSSSTWQPYATTLPWTLTSGNGEKTVYAKYRDVNGNILATVNASIDLVQGQVLGASTTCGIYLNDYIKLGANNNPLEVKKLQAFLDENLGTQLSAHGRLRPRDVSRSGTVSGEIQWQRFVSMGSVRTHERHDANRLRLQDDAAVDQSAYVFSVEHSNAGASVARPPA